MQKEDMSEPISAGNGDSSEIIGFEQILIDVEEAIRALRWLKEFCEAHHAGEPAGVHLHRLLVDIPHYLDYAIATLERE